MARIKGKWVGQVVIDLDMYDFEKDEYYELWKEHVYGDYITDLLKNQLAGHICWPDRSSLTITKLHADLYRDEPSEWTKEEATP